MEAMPIVGAVVRCASTIGGGAARSVYAYVISIAPIVPDFVGANGEPSIGIVYLDPGVAFKQKNKLGTSIWHEEITRASGVKHASHPDVVNGLESLYWLDVLPSAGEAISLPAADFDEELAAGPVERGTSVLDDERTGLSVITDGAGALTIANADGSPYFRPSADAKELRFSEVGAAQQYLATVPAPVLTPEGHTLPPVDQDVVDELNGRAGGSLQSSESLVGKPEQEEEEEPEEVEEGDENKLGQPDDNPNVTVDEQNASTQA